MVEHVVSDFTVGAGSMSAFAGAAAQSPTMSAPTATAGLRRDAILDNRLSIRAVIIPSPSLRLRRQSSAGDMCGLAFGSAEAERMPDF
jgi:hypothetical protein